MSKKEFDIKQTSYRFWEMMDEEGDIFNLWADPEDGHLHCSCRYFVKRRRHRLCQHIRYLVNYQDKEEMKNE